LNKEERKSSKKISIYLRFYQILCIFAYNELQSDKSIDDIMQQVKMREFNEDFTDKLF